MVMGKVPMKYEGGEKPNNAIRAQKTFTPIGDCVCLQMFQFNQTIGGLQLPDSAINPDVSGIGQVISVGPECKQVKEGDVVITEPMGIARAVIFGGQCQLLIMPEKQIRGVATDEYKEWRPVPRRQLITGEEKT